MALNLKKWRDVMEAYLDETKGDGPGFAYYTTMPTDALQLFRDAGAIVDNAKHELALQVGYQIDQTLPGKMGQGIGNQV